ncbi:hypothetical protein GCM10022393_08330 [Aquimarina addita]|uniref:Receptor L-domain domain-containing protein n=1 Tax=Aquimarina addita TaxID=870485 RepID=A0ABP7XD98_9FLAO
MNKKITKKHFYYYFLICVIFIVSSCSNDDDNQKAETKFSVGQLILSGDITDDEAKIKITESLNSDTQTLIIRNTTNLTTIEIPEITSLINLEVSNNQKLKQLYLYNITSISNTSVIEYNEVLQSIDFSKLEEVGAATISYNPLLQNILFTSLQSIYNELNIYVNASLQSISANNLSSAGLIRIGINEQLSTLEMNTLSVVDETLQINYNNTLKAISFPKLVSCNVGIGISLNENLGTVSFPVLTSVSNIDKPEVSYNGYFTITGGVSPSNITLPNLETAKNLTIGNDNLETLIIPKLNSCLRFVTYSDKILSSVELNSLQEFESLDFDDSTFSTDVMDSVLNQLVSITPSITNKTIQLSGEVSITGQEKIDLLMSNGNTITFK